MLARAETELETNDTEASVDAISMDETFDVLRNSRRRDVLREIAAHDGPMRFGELVDRVAARENDTEPGAVDSGTRKAVYTSLYQSHLPKLDEMGVISHERQSGPVAAGPHMAEVLECLAAVEEIRAGASPAEEKESAGGWNSIRTAVGL